MTVDPFSQEGFRIRLHWGRDGARRAAGRGDVIVIVDVLSFSSAVATAVHYGGVVIPCSKQDDADAIALCEGGVAAVHRKDVPSGGRYSLSPLTFVGMDAGTVVVLPSPNGATCSRFAAQVPHLFVASLLNARATAEAVAWVLESSRLDCTVVACGERWEWSSEEGEGIRFAIEDYLGAGAVISRLAFARSPEAMLCESAFLASEERLPAMLHDCGSGRELNARGFAADVDHVARLDLYHSAAVMRRGRIERF